MFTLGNLFNVIQIIKFKKSHRENELYYIPYILYSKNLKYYPIIEIILMIPRTTNRFIIFLEKENIILMYVQIIFDSIQGFLFCVVCVLNNKAFRRDLYRWCKNKKKQKIHFLDPELDFNNNIEIFINMDVNKPSF